MIVRSRIVGRADCPECGEPNAQVKESDKCLYRYCPECGSQHYAKSARQRADLTAKTRFTATATGGAAKPPAVEVPATVDATATTTGSDATATATTDTAAPAKRRGLFS